MYSKTLENFILTSPYVKSNIVADQIQDGTMEDRNSFDSATLLLYSTIFS